LTRTATTPRRDGESMYASLIISKLTICSEVAISGLEQLSLSVMLQLEAGMRAIIKKEATKTKIVIELARRDKRNKEG
jgi:hypothetical protein